ncbi:pseudouridine synthase [Fluviispira multicolorata]|uniref:Pseudouridine synthase n=1 Tax=Fluviispira multicolorata TaxID=2654512 RepID=A0A833N268_9BACT|nr:pseudouridine synthase [Fluviispira multicolorata]KAB8032017.1 pseudouridine synthase [Fluviispira multicolorata]
MSKDQKNELIRLNVLLQELGAASRRKADELIEAGKVKVNGKVIKKLGIKVESGSAISVDGKLLKNAPPKVTYILNKPFMTITSRKDEKERPTIFDLPDLKKLSLNVQSVGRLDYRSEGLLVLTNDGDLALALSHPKYSVEKTYAVLLSGPVNIEDAEKLKKGIELEDGPAKALSVKIGNKETLGNSVGQWLELVVTEGRNRLVRRMMEALGLSVVRLVRVAIGDLRLPGKLEPGKMRQITEQEGKYLGEIKLEMLSENKKNKKPSVTLPKEILDARKLKRKMKLNDADYAREAERRDMRSSQVIRARKQKENDLKKEKRNSWNSEEKPTEEKNGSRSSYRTEQRQEKNVQEKKSYRDESKDNKAQDRKKSDGNSFRNKKDSRSEKITEKPKKRFERVTEKESKKANTKKSNSKKR